MEGIRDWREVGRFLNRCPITGGGIRGRGKAEREGAEGKYGGVLIHPKVNAKKKTVKLRVECNALDCS